MKSGLYIYFSLFSCDLHIFVVVYLLKLFHFYAVLLIITSIYSILGIVTAFETCHYLDFFKLNSCNTSDPDVEIIEICNGIKQSSRKSSPIFLFYDVNPGEGFNLRRDVYIRLAVFIHEINQKRKYSNVYMVLPPFHRLYHWMITEDLGTYNLNMIKYWSHFFDIPSLRRYVQVLDLHEYFRLMKICFNHKDNENYLLNHVFHLKYFESMFSSGKFEEKFEVQKKCDKQKYQVGHQFIQLFPNFTIKHFHCMEYQGSAMLLIRLLNEYVIR